MTGYGRRAGRSPGYVLRTATPAARLGTSSGRRPQRPARPSRPPMARSPVQHAWLWSSRRPGTLARCSVVLSARGGLRPSTGRGAEVREQQRSRGQRPTERTPRLTGIRPTSECRKRFSDPDASWGRRSSISVRKGGGYYGYNVPVSSCGAGGRRGDTVTSCSRRCALSVVASYASWRTSQPGPRSGLFVGQEGPAVFAGSVALTHSSRYATGSGSALVSRRA